MKFLPSFAAPATTKFAYALVRTPEDFDLRGETGCNTNFEEWRGAEMAQDQIEAQQSCKAAEKTLQNTRQACLGRQVLARSLFPDLGKHDDLCGKMEAELDEAEGAEAQAVAKKKIEQTDVWAGVGKRIDEITGSAPEDSSMASYQVAAANGTVTEAGPDKGQQMG